MIENKKFPQTVCFGLREFFDYDFSDKNISLFRDAFFLYAK